jgi:hypothetical protein
MTLIVVDNRSRTQGISMGSRNTASEIRVRPGPIPLNRMEVSVRTESNNYPTSQETRCGSYIDAGQQESYKAHEVSLNVDVESGPEEK